MPAVVVEHRLAPVEAGACRCGRPAVRTLGRLSNCRDCAEDVIDEIRAHVLARDGIGSAVPTGRARREYGRRILDVTCSVCGASWCDEPSSPCPWCEDRLAEQQRAERERLLRPDWLDQHPRYDELGALDRRVWDATRGRSGEGSRRTWAERLARAVRAELVTPAEAERALRRAGRG